MAVSEIGEENSWDAWKFFYCADFVRNFVVFVELYDPPARGREGRSVLASNYIKTLVDQRGWPREFLSQFHKSVCPFLLLLRKILLYRLFSWAENTTNARRQLRNGLRIILSYVLQPALTPDPVAHPPRPLYARQCVSACMPLYRPAFSFYNLLSTVARLRRLATKSQPCAVCVCVCVCTDTRCVRGCNVTTGTTWEYVCVPAGTTEADRDSSGYHFCTKREPSSSAAPEEETRKRNFFFSSFRRLRGLLTEE